MDVTFGLLLAKLTKRQDLFITLHIHFNKPCTESLEIVASALYCNMKCYGCDLAVE